MTAKLLTTIMCLLVLAASAGAEEQDIAILYPKNNSIVGEKVNVVIDPATDWSMAPFFQVTTGKKEYPVVDTSTSRHAFQGVELEPGINTITVKVFAPLSDEQKKAKKPEYRVTSKREIIVFSMVELFTGRYAPADFAKSPFHSRENEEPCSGCHVLETTAGSPPPKKPEDAVCYACHREMPKGKHMHGPAAVWNCLGCHDPGLYPAKYQFNTVDPWRVYKTVHAVVPVVFTVSTEGMFRNLSRRLRISKEQAKDLFKEALSYAKQNPGEIVRLEVHSDNRHIKSKYYKNQRVLSAARARTLARLFKEFGVPAKKIHAAGMGDRLPKASNKTPDGREINNRIEIVIYPSYVKVRNSMKLPVIRSRERVTINLSYTQERPLKKVTVVEQIPKGNRYLKGSSYFAGRSHAPKIKGNTLVWELDGLGRSFQEILSYVLVKKKKAANVSDRVELIFTTSGGHEIKREFDPNNQTKTTRTVQEVCLGCHYALLKGPSRHGPADVGFCNLCHDPHASKYSAWLRKPSYRLCTTCHTEKADGNNHVLAGFVSSTSHPTHGKKDPSRPGKRLSCTSCHSPHSALTTELYTFEAKTRSELCGMCHRKK